MMDEDAATTITHREELLRLREENLFLREQAVIQKELTLGINDTPKKRKRTTVDETKECTFCKKRVSVTLFMTRTKKKNKKGDIKMYTVNRSECQPCIRTKYKESKRAKKMEEIQ